MSFYIDTSSPDLQDFDPTQQGLPLPPVGNYANTTFNIVNIEPGQTKTGMGKLDVTYQAQDGEIAGQSFKLTYNTGHSNPDTAKWAVQDLLRVVSAITGEKNFPRGVEFDEKLYKRPFVATLEVTNQIDKQTRQPITDENGKPYRNGKLKAFVFPDSNNQQSAQQPIGQPQRAQQPVGQPQSANYDAQGTTPPWQSNNS